MEIFGIGAPEILLIMAVALIIFGPDKLPEFAREAGKMVRQFRQLTSEATTEIRSLTSDLNISEDLKRSIEEIKSASSFVTEEVTSLKNEVTGTLTEQYKVTYETAPETENPSTEGTLTVTTVTSSEEGSNTPKEEDSDSIYQEGHTLHAIPPVTQSLIDSLVEKEKSSAISSDEADSPVSTFQTNPAYQSPSELAASSYLNNNSRGITSPEELTLSTGNQASNGEESFISPLKSDFNENGEGILEPEVSGETVPKTKPRIAKRSAFGGSRNRNRE